MSATAYRLPDPLRRRALQHVLAAGAVAGLLDIVFAMGFWWLYAQVPPLRIAQSVAAGVLGRDAAVAGGAATGVIGLALHFFIATAMAAVYVIAARRWPALWQRPWACGTVYGLLLYATMTWVVVPLSAAGGGGGNRVALWVACSVMAHIVLVAWPCAWFARRCWRSAPLHETTLPARAHATP